jgi:hypothetical protein
MPRLGNDEIDRRLVDDLRKKGKNQQISNMVATWVLAALPTWDYSGMSTAPPDREGCQGHDLDVDVKLLYVAPSTVQKWKED